VQREFDRRIVHAAAASAYCASGFLKFEFVPRPAPEAPALFVNGARVSPEEFRTLAVRGASEGGLAASFERFDSGKMNGWKRIVCPPPK
jgi:hypothetical protein